MLAIKTRSTVYVFNIPCVLCFLINVLSAFSFIEIHREGDKKLFNLLEDYDIPVTVFSAGLTGEYCICGNIDGIVLLGSLAVLGLNHHFKIC